MPFRHFFVGSENDQFGDLFEDDSKEETANDRTIIETGIGQKYIFNMAIVGNDKEPVLESAKGL